MESSNISKQMLSIGFNTLVTPNFYRESYKNLSSQLRNVAESNVRNFAIDSLITRNGEADIIDEVYFSLIDKISANYQ